MDNQFPLYSFFTAIQKNSDFSLGIEEYKSLLGVLEKDTDNKYFSNPQEMLKLCKLLWLKPNQNPKLFERLFKNSFHYLKKEIEIENIKDGDEIIDIQENNNPIKEKPENIPNGEAQITDIKTDESNQKSEQYKLENTIKEKENQPLFLNFQSGGGLEVDSNNNFKQNFIFTRNYVPYEQRKLQQIWRFLQKKQTKAQINSQIDINKTIKSCAENGFIYQPIYQKSKINQFSLLTFIDHRGSMLAFKNLATLLAKTAVSGANIKNEVYYFKNVPQQYNSELPEERVLYVYKDIGHIKHIPINEIFINKKDTAVLIISDAGCAKQSINFGRIDATEEFLKNIYSYTLKVAWLNPFPKDRWINTSANIVCEMVNMYEANTDNLRKALNILRGKQQPRSAILFPEILEQL